MARVQAGTDEILALLDGLGVAYEVCNHPPAFTCEEADRLIPALPGPRNRNLFLRDFKGRTHYLLALHSTDLPDLKTLARQLQAKSLSFASPERLEKYLATPVGAVSLLSLANDAECAVNLLVDRALWMCDYFLCHPLRHDCTLVLPRPELERFLAQTGHAPQVLDVPRLNAVPVAAEFGERTNG